MEVASLRDEWPEENQELDLEQQELTEHGLHLVAEGGEAVSEPVPEELEIPVEARESAEDEENEKDDTEPELDAAEISLRGLTANTTSEDDEVEDEGQESEESKVDLSYDTANGSMDSLQLMLREAGRYPLLKPTEEIMLARRIEKGDLGAKERMINSNLRLVVANARRYQGQGLAMNDLVQEGMLGLIRATEKFDWRKGFRFSTYATLWIRQAIQRGLENTSRTIRLPVHVAQRSRKIGRIERELTTKLGHEPTDEEIADMADMPVEEVIEVRQAERSVTSLDKPVGDDADTTFGELLTDKASLGLAERESEDSERRDAVNEALAVLHPREREVIKGRFLPDSGRQKTLDEMGQELGVSRERIRQIEDLALKKLKSSGYLDAFRAQVVGD